MQLVPLRRERDDDRARVRWRAHVCAAAGVFSSFTWRGRCGRDGRRLDGPLHVRVDGHVAHARVHRPPQDIHARWGARTG